MKKSEVFRKLYNYHKNAEQYLDKVPRDISMAVFDNEYTNNQGLMNDLLMNVYFGEHTDDIYWFMYEWKPGYEIGVDGRMTAINDIEEYIAWMIVNENFD